MAIGVGEGQLRAGVGAFLPGDDAHPGGPVAEVEQAGDLRDPRAVARLSACVDRRDPGAFSTVSIAALMWARHPGNPTE